MFFVNKYRGTNDQFRACGVIYKKGGRKACNNFDFPTAFYFGEGNINFLKIMR